MVTLFYYVFVGAWPSGKAPVFGIGIAGSNPAAPAISIMIKILLYKYFGYNLL
tara:strand:+ start:364 stop:522 length:159 start_codon:yes stop_codon:yes gene_type:complete